MRIVVDSGLARRPRYDRGAGLTRLVTERASRAAVTQRAGRAARQAPGVAIRLWEEAATASLPAHDPPEILEADLSSLLLTCSLWGEADPRRLPFLDPPPAAALDEARRRLRALGAIDDEGRVTAHGRAIAALPLEPRLAHMLLEARDRGFGAAAADVAVLLTERGLGGNDPDLELRWRRWRSDQVAPGRSRAQARGRMAAPARHREARGRRCTILARALALAFPDRVSRRRDASGESWQSVGGRGFRLDPASSLAGSQWLAVGEVAGRASGARILSAAAIDEAGGARPVRRPDRDPPRRRLRSRDRIGHADAQPPPWRDPPRRAAPIPVPTRRRSNRRLLDGVREHGLDLLPWDERARQLRHRAAFAHRFDPTIPPLDDECFSTAPMNGSRRLLDGKRRLGDIRSRRPAHGPRTLLGYDGGTPASIRLAPTEFVEPAGSRHPIDYAAPAGPTVEVRAQALFGLAQHPTVAGGKVPLILAITSPAGRPIQTTNDLPGFWAGSWRDVAKDMRGRYPKHPWPDDPASAPPTLADQACVLALNRHHEMRVRRSRPHDVGRGSVRRCACGYPARISLDPTIMTCGPVLIHALLAVGLVA